MTFHALLLGFMVENGGTSFHHQSRYGTGRHRPWQYVIEAIVMMTSMRVFFYSSISKRGTQQEQTF